MIDRPLRLLYVVPDLGVGGAERHVATLLPQMDRNRFEPRAICLGREGELFGALAAGAIPARALHRSKREAVSTIIELVREMRRTAPDIVIVRGYNAETLGRIAAMIARIPHVVVWVHNCGDIEPRSLTRRFVDRVLRPATSAYFGVAEGQVPYLVDELHCSARKVRIIRNGVEPGQFDPSGNKGALAEFGIGRSDPVVGILAALRPEKDHPTLLRAAKLVIEKLPDAKFLIVGDGVLRHDLEELAERLGIAGNVVFAGSRSDGSSLLRSMDVFVLSSSSIECFPMALLEAMAAGRPAVCTAVGGVPEMISDGVTGFLVPPNEPGRLADALVRVLSEPSMRHRMGGAARARVESEFTLARSVDEAEGALEDVAGRRASRSPIRLTLILDLTFVGGVEILMLNVFRHLDPAVVRPRLICLREAGPLADEFRTAGFDVEVLGRRGRYDLHTLPRLIRSLRRDRTDAVLVTHHHRAALALGRIAALLGGVPANLVAAHDMDLTSVGKRCLPRWAVETLFLSDALVLLSPRQGDYLHSEEGVGRFAWRRTREAVIPNGIEMSPIPRARDRERARVELGLDRDDFVVGIVARLSAQKAHQVLFEAFAVLARSCPSARLVVIGGGEREAELRSLATSLGIAGLTRFTGIRRDVWQLLPGLDVSCLSSVHEGLPVTVIESMAAGLPIVSTDCGSLRDIITNGVQGYLVPVGDMDAMARSLVALADDPGLRARLGEQGRARAERQYRIDLTARGFECLLADLVGAR